VKERRAGKVGHYDDDNIGWMLLVNETEIAHVTSTWLFVAFRTPPAVGTTSGKSRGSVFTCTHLSLLLACLGLTPPAVGTTSGKSRASVFTHLSLLLACLGLTPPAVGATSGKSMGSVFTHHSQFVFGRDPHWSISERK
jgi:hypothetical protein